MDNLTHSLVGLTGAKAGLERLSPYATTVCVLAANAPDVDVLTRFGGSWFALQHHRGITHSIVGTLTLGLLLPLVCCGLERIITRLRGTRPRIRLRGLLLASLLACATHPVLDWLNNYGVRPLLPWDGRWFYGDILFIFDPWLWLLLGGAACLLTARARRWRSVAWSVLALVLTAAVLLLPERAGMPLPVAARVLWLAGVAFVVWARYARVPERFGAHVAQTALALVVLYCATLFFVHARALAQARADAEVLARQHGERVLRLAAMPTLANPTRWLTIAETDRATYRFPTRLPASSPSGAAEVARFAKPEGARAEVARAAGDTRAVVFLNFARFPVIQLQTPDPDHTLVQFADLRFSVPGQARTTPARGFTLEVLVPRASQ